VSDVVDVTILLAESDKTGIFNVNCGRPVSVNDLALEISRLLRVDIAPVYQSPRAGEVRHLSGDIGRLSGLGFVPSYDIQKGLGEMISGEK
jgi:UDP-glucose 4-epimerase